MNELINKWMNDIWINSWIYQWMNERIHEGLEERRNKGIIEWRKEGRNSQMKEWIKEGMNKCRNEWMIEWIVDAGVWVPQYRGCEWVFFLAMTKMLWSIDNRYEKSNLYKLCFKIWTILILRHLIALLLLQNPFFS